jgi:hypothetical protein
VNKRYAFHDTTLSSYVKNAYHALSIDERRGPFEPTLWVKKKKADGSYEDPTPGQTVEQVWFAGVHSDVGGGYAEAGLAEIPLRWMAAKAQACGLVFLPDSPVTKAADPRGQLHDSMTWFYKLLGPYDRELKARDAVAVDDWLGSTARARYDADHLYRPLGLEGWITGGRGEMDVG